MPGWRFLPVPSGNQHGDAARRTPHAAGVAALIDAQSNGRMKSGQLKTKLHQSADDLGKKGADAATGKGRVNACTAVNC